MLSQITLRVSVVKLDRKWPFFALVSLETLVVRSGTLRKIKNAFFSLNFLLGPKNIATMSSYCSFIGFESKFLVIIFLVWVTKIADYN